MSSPQRKAGGTGRDDSLRHVRRDVRTALELAVVTLAPRPLVDRLATSAGLLEALVEPPSDSPPVIALVPKLMTRTRSALADWKEWHDQHLRKKIPQS